MTGYDPDFLAQPVPLPCPAGRPTRLLDYTHFSVVHDTVRRLAAVTAVNIDGDRLVDVPRSGGWRRDDRLAHDEQCGNELYRHNDLDRGHLVRRRDPVWGDDARQANDDTFYYTNAAPQHADFNQSLELWLGLEDHVLGYAEAHEHRVSVFTAPVLGDDDPEYRGVGIPLAFWKVAAWMTAADDRVVLRSAGFLLDQSPQLQDFEWTARADAVPPLGPFRAFQVPLAEIVARAGLDLGPLVAADALAAHPGLRSQRRELFGTADIALT